MRGRGRERESVTVDQDTLLNLGQSALRAFGWFNILDGLATVALGKGYEHWLAENLPPGTNQISAYFSRWREVPLRLSGLLQAAAGYGMLRAASTRMGH